MSKPEALEVDMWYLLLCPESTSHALLDEQAIFANNELGMRHIDVYGFDYDYTLASYSDAMHFLIYDLAVKELVTTYGVSSLSHKLII